MGDIYAIAPAGGYIPIAPWLRVGDIYAIAPWLRALLGV